MPSTLEYLEGNAIDTDSPFALTLLALALFTKELRKVYANLIISQYQSLQT